ncbi:hypothetical protein IFM89_035282 [Coptis chinensis]|uniref:Uncharacterized protein n=1 Tax=Coptis chinensis TaxID=261450 RepID=A0A835H287_9MAGN|nr:hypothetical protein IFM89_035282 [Coptis chinensis]
MVAIENSNNSKWEQPWHQLTELLASHCLEIAESAKDHDRVASALVIEVGVGIAVLVNCFVHKHDMNRQIKDRLGDGFSRAPFATLVCRRIKTEWIAAASGVVVGCLRAVASGVGVGCLRVAAGVALWVPFFASGVDVCRRVPSAGCLSPPWTC